MFDIFQEKEQPKLYIADIIVEAKIPSKGKIIKYDTTNVNLHNQPIVLIYGKFPTKNTEDTFFRRVYQEHIHKGDFSKIKFSIKSIDNIRFSSNLMYKFDYNLH
jgi:hypothetical protein